MMLEIITRIRLPLLCVALWTCVALLGGCTKDQTWKPGAPAPQITVLDLQDTTVKLSDFKGKVVVLRFWATGCKVCVAERPVLDTLRKKYPEQDLAVLGVNMGGSKELVAAFAKGLKITYPVLRDPAMIAAKKYAVKSAPTTYFIDRNGLAKEVIVGDVPQKVFDKIVGSLL